MKTKEEAAKLLLEAGWTLEEILQVLQISAVPDWVYYFPAWPSPPIISWESDTSESDTFGIFSTVDDELTSDLP